MNFLTATYSGVTWYQLAVPWIGLVFFMILAVIGWAFAVDQKSRADLQEQITGLYERSFLKKQELADRLNDKVISLEAQISRITVRPRGKNGRFEMVEKV